MATASVGHAALVINEGPSFGQFRLNQFVDDTTPRNALSHPNATDAQHAPASYNLELMAQVTRPSSGQNSDRPPSVAPSRQTPQDHHQSNPSPAVLGSLELGELASNPLIEGILGPNKDGRVRNPVPSKLKGKTDNKQGNFGVMHMGMSPGKKSEAQGRDAAAERDAAARRTSENTASRAKAAQSEKYVPPKKRGLEAALGDSQSANHGSPFAVSRDDHRQRARPLAPDETKFEQARLLTLLRSINPVTVVDQICKAVAYFGGIPGAPPPEDGIFPESANTRETGALFIGWLAEIFPDVTARSPEVPKEPLQTGGKKKARPSKGGKTSLPLANADAAQEAPNSRNGYGYGPAVSAPAWGLPQSLALVNTPAPPTPIPLPEARQSTTASRENHHKDVGQQPPSTPIQQQQPEDIAENSTSKRRRGRPKGSRNKGRGEDGADTAGAPAQQDAQNQGQQIPESPQAQITSVKMVQANQPPSESTSFNPNVQPSVPKPAQNQKYADQSWNTHPQQATGVNNGQNAAQSDGLSPEERAVLEAFRHQGPDGLSAVPSPVAPVKSVPEAGQKRKRAPPKPKAVHVPPPSFPMENNKNISSVANGQNSGALQRSGSMQTPATIQNTGVLNNSSAFAQNIEAPVGMAKDGMQWATPDTSTTPVPPPPKRIRNRKPKATVPNDPPSRTQTASVVSSATPPTQPSTIPDSQATSSQQSVPVTRPPTEVSRPAEGLEAHYERFANLQQQSLQQQNLQQQNLQQQNLQQQNLQQQNLQQQNLQQQQQNGRSHTPTVPQQQVRQQQPKPTPVPPQQSTPQLQQQQLQQQHQQMQQQKSQQNNQQSVPRDDQKLTQAPTVRPSSTTFYNQRSQSSSSNYAQQYPSHQPSQLYSGSGHQASPQMSNNTYRSTNSHTLAQSSPQFSQAENSYRTASPHTIAQPSPSFSQTDSTFRSNNTHTLAQPSPSYTQAENPYRTPSTHSMAQASPSYTTSRSHTQTQPSHQNHYSNFSDSTYLDLPTLESLGHTGTGNTTNVGSVNNVGLGTGAYGQGMGVGLGTTSRSSATTNNIYGSSSGLNNPYDTASDLLRGVSRSTSHTNAVYGTSGLNSAYDTGASEHEMRERLLRGLGRR